jgi:hypothetical protein
VAVVVVGLATLTAGCGAGGDGDADAASDGDRREQFRAAALDFAQCMRDEGIDMPDPQFGDGGGMTMRLGGPDGPNPDTPGFEEADEKCREHLEKVEPPELSEGQQQEFQQAALDFARCMRGEGIDMPDPQFEGGGRVRIGPGPGSGAGPLDRDDPAFQEAFETCRDELPEGRGGGPGAAPAP